MSLSVVYSLGKSLAVPKMRGIRFLHHSYRLNAVDKSSLAKLRKLTGFSMINCKKALEMHDNDISKAQEWLNAEAQAQGWAKATKLSGRKTVQGLVGVHIEGNVGTLVEVNCETDFVARNNEFRTLVEQVAKECAAISSSSSPQVMVSKEFLSGEQLKGMATSDGKTLADHLALTIGMIGENMSLNRAARLVAPEGIRLLGYSHPSPPDQTELLGKFGAVLAIKTQGMLTDVARQLCIHVVGMNPKAVGSPDDPKAANVDDETLLIHQEFLSDPTMTVGQILEEENIEIVDFVRFECGETSSEE